MAYTSHGHHINGTPTDNPPEHRMRCGGVNLCPSCSKEALRSTITASAYETEILPKDNVSDYQLKAKQMVQDYIVGLWSFQDEAPPAYNVYVVWFSKTLQNWKALVGSTLNDGLYYEVTYNGEKKETYLDTYMKIDNIVIPD